MSESTPQPPASPADGPPPASPADGPPPVAEAPPSVGAAPARGVSGRSLAVVAVVALLVGIGATAVAFVVYDRVTAPEYTFNVSVMLEMDVTTEQKDAVRDALDGIDTVDGVRFESREQAYENFQELFADNPDLVNRTRPDDLPESFRFQTKGRDFDCDVLDRAQDLPGIDEITVVQLPAGTRTPGNVVYCA